MAEKSRRNPDELARQARQHLDSLRTAGVEWLPNAPAPEIVPDSPPAPPAGEVPDPVATLFSEPAAPGQPVEQRRRELEVLAERVSGCTRCAELAATRTQTVFGVGKLDAELCFIGEAPGADEDRQG